MKLNILLNFNITTITTSKKSELVYEYTVITKFTFTRINKADASNKHGSKEMSREGKREYLMFQLPVLPPYIDTYATKIL